MTLYLAVSADTYTTAEGYNGYDTIAPPTWAGGLHAIHCGLHAPPEGRVIHVHAQQDVLVAVNGGNIFHAFAKADFNFIDFNDGLKKIKAQIILKGYIR